MKTSEATREMEADLFVTTTDTADGRLTRPDAQLPEFLDDGRLVQRISISQIADQPFGTFHRPILFTRAWKAIPA